MKLHGGQLVHYKNGTVKASFQLTSCGSLVPPKSSKPDKASGRPALPFQLLVQGIGHWRERQDMVLGFETEDKLKTWEQEIRKHIILLLPPPPPPHSKG